MAVPTEMRPAAAAPACQPTVERGEHIPARWRRAALGLLALAFMAVGLHQAARDAPTVDEGIELSSGVTSLVRRDLRLEPEHPALPKSVAALPALLAHPKVPDTAAYRRGAWFDYSDDFIAANAAAGRLRPMLMWARSVVILESVACAGALYLLAKRTFGPDGGLLAAAAWLTTPYVVGLGHFALIDVAFTLATLVVCLALARWRDRPDVRRSVELGLSLGVTLATRHTGLVLVALAVAVMVHRLRDRPRHTLQPVAVSALVAVVVVWVVYRGIAPSTPGTVAAAGVPATGIASRLVNLLPLPWEWRSGFSYLSLTSVARPSSLFGQSWDGGRWWYFPASAALKVPASLVLAVVIGWVTLLRRRWADPVERTALAATVVLPGLTLWLFLVAQPLDLGLRLALPVLALSYVGLGALARFGPGGTGPGADDAVGEDRAGVVARTVTAGLAVVLLVQMVASASAVPHSLAWTSWPWRPAYRWASDANLDAGQALYEVRTWSKVHHHPYVALDSTRGLAVEGGSRSLRAVDVSAVRGWVGVSVTPLMQTRRTELAWLRAYCPVATIGGGSVLVYRFTSAPDGRPGPETPVAPCWGAPRSVRR